MVTTVAVRDETILGEVVGDKLVLEFFTQQITVRDLIHQRVRQKVEQFNASKPPIFHGLVQPTDTERTLNGFKVRKQRLIDWEKQAERAEEAFMTNGFMVLVDERQVTELDEVIAFRPNSTVTFLKLVPLVGG